MRTRHTCPVLGHAQGFTLIELLVVVSLLAMVLLATAPLATSWASGAQKRESRSKLEQAYGMAKALALRNPCGIRDSSATAAQMKVTVDGTQATVTVLLPGDSSSCSFLTGQANPQWTVQLAPGVSVLMDTTTATSGTPLTLSLSNRGAPLGKTNFSLRKGSDDERVDLS